MLKFNAPFSGTQVGKEAEGEPQQAGNEFETTNSFMGLEPPKYLLIHEIIFLQIFFYFIFFAWSKVGLVQKMFKRLGKDEWIQYKTTPQNFVKKRITKYFGGSDPMNELQMIEVCFRLFKKR